MKQQATLKKPKLVPTLRDRLAAIEAELSDVVEAHCDAIKKQNPLVHRDGIRQRLMARAGGSLAAAFRLIDEGKA